MACGHDQIERKGQTGRDEREPEIEPAGPGSKTDAPRIGHDPQQEHGPGRQYINGQKCRGVAAMIGVEEEGGKIDEISPFLRSEEHTSELQSLMRISYADFCLKKK